MNQDPDQAALDQFNPAAGQISEHYQVDSYGDLILLAQQLGYDNVADTLKQSLGEEQDALDELSELGPEFDYSLF